MSPITIFIFGLGNFLLLTGALLWFLRPAMRQFHFARRARIRKEMLSSVTSLRDARARFAASRAAYDELPKDMAARRAAIGAQCHEVCDAIVEDAKRRAEYLKSSAQRAAAEEQQRAKGRIRAAILRQAFRLAGDQVGAAVTPEVGERQVARALTALDRAAQEMGQGRVS